MRAIGPMARGALRPCLPGSWWARRCWRRPRPRPPRKGYRPRPLRPDRHEPVQADAEGWRGRAAAGACPSDAARLRRIFDLQRRGDLATAARETERLEDQRLLGHVLADRWLRPGGGHATAPEVQAWLAAHADHPEAPELHALLGRLLPRGAPCPPRRPSARRSPRRLAGAGGARAGERRGDAQPGA
ncbi:hypothetical protein ACFQU2_35070 [Siccirubricoccus deserti]